MNKTTAGILLIIVVIALAVFLHYQMLDRRKFMASAHFMNTLDEPVEAWLAAALEIGRIPDAVTEKQQEKLKTLTEEYGKLKTVKTEQKTVLVNEAHALLRRCCAAEAADGRLEPWTERMNEIYDGFLDDVNEYNFYVRRYNQKLETRTGAVVADMLRLKHLTVMDDLRL